MNIRGLVAALSAVLVLVSSPGIAGASEQPVRIPTSDGYALDGKLALPPGASAATVTRVVVLIHGSGQSDMDSDLSAASTDKTAKILLFKDISDALTKKGFAVVRYHKRNHQLALLRKSLLAKGVKKASPQIMKTVRGFVANPLKTFVEDAKSVARFAQSRCPKAALYLLGVSEGTYVALQALNEMPAIKGVSLIGFFAVPLDTLVFEQYVYRAMYWFRSADKNHDLKLDKAELAGAGTSGLNLLRQLSVFDLNQNGALDASEYHAACLFDWYKFPRISAYTIQTAKYPAVQTILKKTSAKVAFFQGLFDNQTPAYHAQSIQVLARYVWKKTTFHFHFFPKLGHILHPQPRYETINYKPIDPTALTQLSTEMDSHFR